MKILNQRKKAAVEAAKANTVLVLPPSPVAAAAQDIGISERSYFEWRFKVGDSVFTDPDTRPNVRGNQGEAFNGTVAEIDPKTCFVTIKSCHSNRLHPAIHESRVFVSCKSVNGNDCRDTRAASANSDVHLQRELEQAKMEIVRNKNKMAVMKGRLDALEEAQPSIRQLRRQMDIMAGEVEELRASNVILRHEIADLDSSATSAREIFSRKGPSPKAIPLMHGIRAIYFEKLLEFEARDEATQQVIDELQAHIEQITLQLDTEANAHIDLKREIRVLKGENKRYAKALDDTAAASALDEERDDFQKRIDRRLQYLSRCSSYTSEKLLKGTFSQTFLNNERRQVGIEQGVLNAWKLAYAVYYRQFFNDGSDKNGVNIMCTSILVVYANGECEFIILTAADPPRDKTARGGFNSVMLVLEYHRQKLTMFTKFCKDRGINVSNFPNPDDITLEKMADASVNMSDHCVVALSMKAMVNALVRQLAEGKYTQEYLDALTPAERKALCNIIDMGCLPHLRALLAEAQVKAEAAFIKANFPVHEQFKRMEPDCDMLILAIQKYIGAGVIIASRRNDFFAYNKIHHPTCLIRNLGRAGNGNRQDHAMEVGSKVAMLRKELVDFAYADDKAASTILSKSVKLRISDRIFDIVLRHRHLWWIKFYRYLRKLWNNNDSAAFADAGHCTMLTYVVMDQIEEKLKVLKENPALLYDSNWHFFSVQQNPCLAPFMSELSTRTKRTYNEEFGSLTAIETTVAYELLTADEQRMMNSLTVMFCDAALNKLYALAPHFLTSRDGCMSEGKISVEVQAKLKSTITNNVKTCESTFARVDAQGVLSGPNIHTDTLNSIVIAQLGRLFEGMGNCPNWNDQLTIMCMAFSKSTLDFFIKQEEQKKRLQEMATQERLVENALMAIAGSVAVFRKAISFFSLSYTLKHITTKEQFRAVLEQADMQTIKAKTQFCKYIILLEHFGYGKTDVKKEMSSSTVKAVGTLDDVQQRCVAIYENPTRVVQVTPPVYAPAASVSPHMPTEQYSAIIADQTTQVRALQDTILETHRNHCTTLQWSYNNLQIIEFESVPLSTAQKEFKAGRVFTLDGVVYVVNGLSWDQKQKDYCVWYHALDLIPQPTHMTDVGVEHINFKSYDVAEPGGGGTLTSVKGIQDINIVWR